MLLDSLRAKQTEAGLSDPQFAARLGVSYELWRSIRYTRRPIGTLALRGILIAYPDLREDVLFHLTNYGIDVSDNGTRNHTTEEDNDPVGASGRAS